jgi:hypothetical protein
MAFVKLDTDILTSSLWVSRGQRDVFITALLMAVPKYFPDPVAEVSTGSTEPTGFVVPPGDYGFVRAAGVGILRMALVDEAEGMVALRELAQPDPYSRSTAFEGRRMVRVDGGFLVLNFDRFRQKDSTAAERQARYRQRIAERNNRDVTRNADASTRNITQAEAEAEAEKIVDAAPAKKAERGSRFALTQLPDDWLSFVRKTRPDLDPQATFAMFRDYWTARPGKDGRKLDWAATWRNWVRAQRATGKPATAEAKPAFLRDGPAPGEDTSDPERWMDWCGKRVRRNPATGLPVSV